MNKHLILATLLLTGIIFYACDSITNIIPSDDVSSQQHIYSDYDRIETESAFTVNVEFSDTEESIEIEANDNLHQHIEVKKDGSALKIGFRDNISIKGSATLNAHITTKHVTGYAASGASRIYVDDELSAEDVSVFLSGASQFVGELYVTNFNIELSGASMVQLTGESKTSNLTASGASVVGDFGFITEYLNVNLSGASMVAMTVSDKLDVRASGASIMRYKGSGIINSQNLTGESQIIKVD
jgi:hypothetical protein